MGITEAIFPTTVHSFGTNIFDKDYDLKRVTIEFELPKISAYMFYECKSLEYLQIGGIEILSNSVLDLSNSVINEIDTYAFAFTSFSRVIFSGADLNAAEYSFLSTSLEIVEFNAVPSSFSVTAPFHGCFSLRCVQIRNSCSDFSSLNIATIFADSPLADYSSWCDIVCSK